MADGEPDMIDLSTLLWLIAGVAFLFVTAAVVRTATNDGLDGLFAKSDQRDWPRGVQESDVPRFAIEHLDSLRRGSGA
jgi:hypothetical protein